MAVATTRANPSSRLSPSQIANLWVQAGGDKALAPLMVGISAAESGWDPGALNIDTSRYAIPTQANPHHTNHNSVGAEAIGLWQINQPAQGAQFQARYSVASLFDPLTNARAAVELAGAGGAGIQSNWAQTYAAGQQYAQTFGSSAHGGGITGAVSGVAGGILNTGLGGLAGLGIPTPFGTINTPSIVNAGDVGLPNTPSAQNQFLKKLGGTEKYVLYGVAILGGGLLIIFGLILIGLDIGLGSYNRAAKNPVLRVVGSGAQRTRDRFKPKPEPEPQPVSLAERREARQQALHRAKLRKARADARSAEHGATEAKRRAERAKSVQISEIQELQMGRN